MSKSISELIVAMDELSRYGRPAIVENYDQFAITFGALLQINPSVVPDKLEYRRALVFGFSYFYWKWDPRSLKFSDEIYNAIIRWSVSISENIDLVCDLFDFYYFLMWVFEPSNAAQCRNMVPIMQTVSAGFARTASPKTEAVRPAAVAPPRIAWLAMFAEHANAMSSALRHIAPVLLASGRYELLVYAWRFVDEPFLAWLRSLGVLCHVFPAETPSRSIAAIEAQAAKDSPVIVISDMNNAVPTALFSRRIAPAQIFLQAGMPGWAVQNLDGVFNSFGFTPEVAGWGEALVLPFNGPWDLVSLAQPADPASLRQERALFPANRRLLGCYGRLVKVTQPYLEAIEQILLRCPEVVYVTGGTGNPEPIRSFAARSPVGGRIHVEARFVPGHIWGRILDIYLDTWPLLGGESCREMLAKSRPVVSLHSGEMPAMDEQRDEMFLASNWEEFVAMTVRLVEDAEIYWKACRRARALAVRMADTGVFARRLVGDLDRVLAHARGRAGKPRRRAW